MNEFKFTILTPTWERNKRLKRAVRSVLKQSWENWEMIIVDDGSEKVETEKIMEEFLKDPRIRLIKNPKNQGVNVARNLGLKNVSEEAEWILQLDSDDELVSEALEKMAKEIEANPGKKFWWWGTKDEKGKVRGWVKNGSLEVNLEDFFLKIDKEFGGELLPLWHKSLKEIVKFDEEIFFTYEGISWLSILKSGEKLQMRNEPLRIYWQNENGITRPKKLTERHYQSMKKGEEKMLKLFERVISKNKKIWARSLAVLGRAEIKLGMRKMGLRHSLKALRVNFLEVRGWYNLGLWVLESLHFKFLP